MPLKIKKKKGFPRPPCTAMEVYEMLPEGTHVEVIDKVMYFLPERLIEHQDCLGKIICQILIYADKNNLGKAVGCPLGIYFDDENVIEPDIIFIKNETLGIVKKGKVKGTPDLLMEILSDEDQHHDLIKKLDLYERFSVPEYFIINPLTKEVLHYTLAENKHQQQPVTNGKINSFVLQSSFSF